MGKLSTADRSVKTLQAFTNCICKTDITRLWTPAVRAASHAAHDALQVIILVIILQLDFNCLIIFCISQIYLFFLY